MKKELFKGDIGEWVVAKGNRYIAIMELKNKIHFGNVAPDGLIFVPDDKYLNSKKVKDLQKEIQAVRDKPLNYFKEKNVAPQ